VGVAEHFAGADPAVRDAFEGLVELASVDGPMTVVAQKTRIVLAAPMRFVAVQVHRDRLTGHILAEHRFEHRVITDVVPNAYETGLYLHRLSIHSAGELDDAFAAFIAEAAARVGRRERLARSGA